MGGSGNTWMRTLLEYITLISTGSVYTDTKYKTVFNAEGQCSEKQLVCKAHPIWFHKQQPPVSMMPEGAWQKNKKNALNTHDGIVWLI